MMADNLIKPIWLTTIDVEVLRRTSLASGSLDVQSGTEQTDSALISRINQKVLLAS